jgi:hypothetical protein
MERPGSQRDGQLASIPATVLGACIPGGVLKLLDYGLRGVAPVAGGRLELSVGLGGGYILCPKGFYRPNQTLFQYSCKIAFALDRLGRTRLTFAVRTWRDLGRPTTHWLSTAAGISYGFGHVQQAARRGAGCGEFGGFGDAVASLWVSLGTRRIWTK